MPISKHISLLKTITHTHTHIYNVIKILLFGMLYLSVQVDEIRDRPYVNIKVSTEVNAEWQQSVSCLYKESSHPTAKVALKLRSSTEQTIAIHC